MRPIFKEYIQFLKDNGIDLPIEEGYYWLDRQIIKAYDTQGNLHKLYRIKIDDDLNITYTKYKYKIIELENWQDTIKRKIDGIIHREKESIKIVQDKLNQYNDYQPIVLTSTGKDSEVVRYLVSQLIDNLQIVFNNTSLDCADTYKMAKNIPNYKIINPNLGFYQWIKDNIIPTRFSRGCCRIFKEGAMIHKLDKNKKYLFFIGMRNEESVNRSKYETEWKNEKWGNRDWIGILPIRKWSE